jgi:hypothetical protein
MASAASLYGESPAQSSLLSGLGGQAFDSGQFMSANNMLPTASTDYGAALGGLNLAISGISSIGNTLTQNTQLSNQIKNYKAQAAALEKTRDRYIYTFNRDTKQLDASQVVGYISSGLSLESGTPVAVRAATSKQRAMEESWTVQNYNTQIKSLKQAAASAKKQKLIGNIFGLATGGIALAGGIGVGGFATGLFGGE